MKVELLATGDELLKGAIVDSNSAFLLALLYDAGLRVERTGTAPDDQAKLRDAILEAAGRADAVVVSGGLGPTADDVTAAAAAEAAGVGREVHQPSLERLRARWASRGLGEMPPNNLRQVTVPVGSEVMPNPEGSCAPFVLRVGKATCFFLPGVPREYRQIAEFSVVPKLVALGGGERLVARTLHCYGIAESAVDHAVKDLVKATPDVRWGWRTRFPENMLSMAVRGRDPDVAAARLADVAAKARALLGDVVWGADGDTFGAVVGSILRRRHETLALAESCTGGMASALLTDVAGASDYVLLSAVTYANSAKESVLGVPAALLAAHGAVSEPVARAMAEGARRVAGATWGLSISGIAGPGGGSVEKPVGTVHCALAGPGGTTATVRKLPGDRGQVRTGAVWMALELLRRELLKDS